MTSPQSRILIRDALATDAKAVARIYVDSWNDGYSHLMGIRKLEANLIGRWRQDLTVGLPYRWWVAERAATIMGFVGIGPSRDPINADLGELDTIAVDSPYWRSGVGRALMSQAVQSLCTDGYSEAVVWTLANYPRGQRFYEAMGWALDGAVRDDGRQVCYRLRLRE